MLLLAVALVGVAYLIARVIPVAPLPGKSHSDSTSTPVAPSPPAGIAPTNGTPAPSADSKNPGQSQQQLPTTPDPALPLKGRRIGLDPGHGPRGDLGAVLVD